MKKNKKGTLADDLKEIAAELIAIAMFTGVCVIALLISALFPREISAELPFGLWIFLAVVLILAFLYFLSAIVSLIGKIQAKRAVRNESNETTDGKQQAE